jgi:hypothetical protein
VYTLGVDSTRKQQLEAAGFTQLLPFDLDDWVTQSPNFDEDTLAIRWKITDYACNRSGEVDPEDEDYGKRFELWIESGRDMVPLAQGTLDEVLEKFNIISTAVGDHHMDDEKPPREPGTTKMTFSGSRCCEELIGLLYEASQRNVTVEVSIIQ